jgi:uncharacterized protein (DUF433 family)
MVRSKPDQWLGVGVYSLPEAARLVGTNTARIRRWLLGYRFPVKRQGVGHSEPIFEPELPQISDHWAIGFLDLVELLFIKAFRDEGVSLQTIRRAAREAAKRWRTTHPFCLKRLATDGRTIFSTVQDETGEEQLLELTRSQLAFKRVLRPYLKQLDYEAVAGGVDRWWPMGKKQPVYVDPRVAFGKPVVRPVPVPTDILYGAVAADQTPAEVAEWYELPVASVRAALEFERNLAA